MPRRPKHFELDGYEIADPARAYLGEGTYGTVYLARETATGRCVAIKQHHDIAFEEGIPSSVLRETTLLTLLRKSPYVVRFEDVVHVKSKGASQPPTSYMIFEHLDCDLYAYANRKRPLATDVIQRIMYHVLLGIYHCHILGLMHRDLKPHNILIDLADPCRPNAKLADFGFGRSFSIPIRELTQEIITLWYRPPEVLLGFKGHSPAVDIWSVACILCELHENVTPFRGDSQVDQLTRIFRLVGSPTVEEWAALNTCAHWHDFPRFPRANFRDRMNGTPVEGADLLNQMLVHDPAKRPTAEACLRHPYFASVFNESDLELKVDVRNSKASSTIVMPPNSKPAEAPTTKRRPLACLQGSHTNTS